MLFCSYKNNRIPSLYLLMNVEATLNGCRFFVLIVVIIVQKGIIYRKNVFIEYNLKVFVFTFAKLLM